MKYCLIALMILAPLAARAASPEESYLGVRDRYIEKFNPAGNTGEISERTRKDEERARRSRTPAAEHHRAIASAGLSGTGEEQHRQSFFRG